jgi:hypothetical protein
MARRKAEAKLEEVSADASRAGMSTESYNEAVRLQVSIRDYIGFPVTMVQAFDVARSLIHELNDKDRTRAAAYHRNRLTKDADHTASEHAAEQRRISLNAGK